MIENIISTGILGGMVIGVLIFFFKRMIKGFDESGFKIESIRDKIDTLQEKMEDRCSGHRKDIYNKITDLNKEVDSKYEKTRDLINGVKQ